jgi:hypothetical protein
VITSFYEKPVSQLRYVYYIRQKSLVVISSSYTVSDDERVLWADYQSKQQGSKAAIIISIIISDE